MGIRNPVFPNYRFPDPGPRIPDPDAPHNSRQLSGLLPQRGPESDMLNNDCVTPDNVRTATAPFVDNARCFTDGDDPGASWLFGVRCGL